MVGGGRAWFGLWCGFLGARLWGGKWGWGGMAEGGAEAKALPEAEKKKEQSLPFYQLFSFADKYDWILMVSGSVGAVIHGSSMPVFFLLFGEMVNGFGKNQTDLSKMTEEVAKVHSCSDLTIVYTPFLYWFQISDLVSFVSDHCSTLSISSTSEWWSAYHPTQVSPKAINPPFLIPLPTHFRLFPEKTTGTRKEKKIYNPSFYTGSPSKQCASSLRLGGCVPAHVVPWTDPRRFPLISCHSQHVYFDIISKQPPSLSQPHKCSFSEYYFFPWSLFLYRQKQLKTHPQDLFNFYRNCMLDVHRREASEHPEEEVFGGCVEAGRGLLWYRC